MTNHPIISCSAKSTSLRSAGWEPRPVRSILTQFQQNRISYESALSLLLSLGIAWNDCKYYLQAQDYEYSWEVA